MTRAAVFRFPVNPARAAKSWCEPADELAMTSRAQGTGGPSGAPLVSEYAGDCEMADLIEFFVAELRERIGAMSEAWQNGDLVRLRSHVHQLEGAAGGYGFPSITQSAAELDTALRVQPAEIRTRLEALIDLCRRATKG